MLENSKTDKRRLEEFSDSLKFYFPASKVSLPNKRARIEAMPDIFEVIDESRSLSCKSFTDSVEGDDSCEKNKDDQKHLIRSSREELLERNQMQQRQDDGKFLVKSPKSFSTKADSKQDKTYTRNSGIVLRKEYIYFKGKGTVHISCSYNFHLISDNCLQ